MFIDVIHAFSTGTKYGMSHFEDIYSCDRKAWHLLRMKEAEQQGQAPIFMQQETGKKGIAAMLAGSLYGAAWEKFYGGHDIPPEFRFTFEGLDVETLRTNTAREARRCFNGFRQVASRSDYGEVLGTEVQYEAPPGLFAGPATGAADLRCRLSATDVARIEQKYGIQLYGPGVYIVDAKLMGRHEEDRARVWTMRVQGKLYQILDNVKYNEEVKGFIYDVCYKTNEIDRELFVTPPVDTHDLKMVARMIEKRESVRRVPETETLANPTADCHKCFLYEQGKCLRY